ncbi:metallophosphoesterase [Rhodobium gokarnense]|uniref:3',5'-cyclic AMP phosphodiesterase CpdA n=1 Tax=Rhodobium gokarnense TaxID=364296 RepID=A0ABT3H631_9HYPH|nr:metallophosphoesterase [Rhodobium gokarnense]MCW2305844.1 3',5'-cyclic AMP phosphodiesterase CpdA [Rhodobium gokarnense]
MKFVVMSDIHIKANADICGRSPQASLARAVTHIGEHHGDADLCILLGDLADEGLPAEYADLADLLSGLPMPIAYTLGNHDDRANFLKQFGEVPRDGNGFIQSVADVGDRRCVLLDTNVPGYHGGRLDGGRLEWLDETLAASDRQCLVFLHHPPIDTALPAFATIALDDIEAVGACLSRHSETVEAVFFGHCHMSVAGMVGRIPAFGLRSLIYQAIPNLADDTFISAPGLPPAYSVIVETGTGLALHVVEFGYDGPTE